MNGPKPSNRGFCDTTGCVGLGIREEQSHGFDEAQAPDCDEEVNGFSLTAAPQFPKKALTPYASQPQNRLSSSKREKRCPIHKMKSKALRNGVQVSEMGLGTMFFGTKVSAEISFELMDLYVEAGGRFLDTANMYAHFFSAEAKGGESETVIGQWMKDRKNREDLFIATKVGVPYPGVERGCSRRQILEECEKSLMRLQTDVIDLYYTHFDDRNTPMEETLEALQSLIDHGKVRYIAASNTRSWRLERSAALCRERGWSPCVCVQNNYTYLYPKGEKVTWPQIKSNQDILDYCSEENLPLVAYGALRKGGYANGDLDKILTYAGPNGISRLQTLQQVARKAEATPNQVVLAWMLHSTSPTIIPLVTASRPDQLRESLAAVGLTLPPDLLDQLNSHP